MKLFTGYFCKSLRTMKAHIVILFLLNFLSAFMYYFVEISVDGNLRALNRKAVLDAVEGEFLVSLQSNKTLAFSFLIMLTLIAAFVHFMFYKQYGSFHQKEIGCFIASGYSAPQIAAAVCLISISFAACAHLLGLCAGWFGSSVLLNNYKQAYFLAGISKGLDAGSFLAAFVIGSIPPALCSLPVFIEMGKAQTADLLSGNSRKTKIRVGKLLRGLTKNTGFSVRLALRKPFQLLMSFFAVGLFTILFLMSASLNLSSQYVYDTQTAGRNYDYHITFSTIQSPPEHFAEENLPQEILAGNSSPEENTPDETLPGGNAPGESLPGEMLYEGDFYLAEPATLNLDGDKLDITVMGIEKNGRYFSLTDRKQESVRDIPEGFVVVSQALSELYGIGRDSVISITVGEASLPFHVCGIAENGEHFTVYTSREALAALLGVPEGSYNGIYAADHGSMFPFPNRENADMTHTADTQSPAGTLLQAEDGFQVQSMAERRAELDKNNVSNRMSAVICQILGCVIGCLLLYLTVLLKFQEDTKNIFILDMLGYSAKQINGMFVSVYRPVLNIAFIILLLPAAEICKMIHRNLSLATNDYIPFQCNVLLIIAIWGLLNVLYSLIKYLFGLKINRVQKAGDTGRYLM